VLLTVSQCRRDHVLQIESLLILKMKSCCAFLVYSVPALPAFGQSREFLTYLPTRLSCEFSQLKVIGKGADGRVYQVIVMNSELW